MILSRFLNAEDFGKIGVLSIIFIVATVLLDSGLGGSLIKEKEVSDIDLSSITCFNVSVSTLIYITLYFSADWIGSLYSIPSLANVVRILSLVFPITAFGIVPKSLLQRNLQFKTICWNYILGVTAGCMVSILVAVKGGGVYALVAYQLITNFVNVVANCICCRYLPSFKLSFNSLKRLLPFGIFTSVISIIDTIYENIMTALIGKFLNVQQAGYLYQAKRIEETLSSSLAGTIGVVTFPILTKFKDNLFVFNKEALSTLKIISWLTFPVLFSVAIYSDQIIVLLFGDKWVKSGFYLETLIFAGVFIILETLLRSYIKALCEVKKLMYATVIKRILGIAIMLLALYINPEYVVYGYIVSALIGYFINSILYIRLSKVGVVKLMSTSFISFFICLLYYILFKYLTSCGLNIIIEMLLSAVTLFFYYVIVLPRMGINVLSLFIHKK